MSDVEKLRHKEEVEQILNETFEAKERLDEKTEEMEVHQLQIHLLLEKIDEE